MQSPSTRISWSPELINLICSEIRLEGVQFPENTQALLALALACKAWKDIALDNLWHTLYNTKPLEMCMQSYLQDIENQESCRPPMVSELENLYQYSSRIRALVLHRPGSLDGTKWDFLSSYLLPNLELLVWYWCDYKSLPPFLRFDPNRDNVPPGYLAGLALRNPRPMSLDFVPSRHPWDRLSSLHINSANIDILVGIAELPKLKRLVINDPHLAWHSSAPHHKRPLLHLLSIKHPFPALESLEIQTKGKRMTTVTRLFRLFRQVNLSQLKMVFICEHDRVHDLREFMQVLRLHCNPKTLKDFQLCYWNLDPSWLDVILPLCDFHALERVKIFGHRAMDVERHHATEMVDAWPNIRVLEITPRQTLNRSTLTTLLCLLPFTECTNLRHLGLSINASDQHARIVLRRRPKWVKQYRSLSLRTLHVGISKISHKEFVAQFLCDAFPNLEDVRSDVDPHQEAWNRRWQYVGQVLLPMLNNVRAGVRGENQTGTDDRGFEERVRKGTSKWYHRDRIEHDIDWSDVEKSEVMRRRVPYEGSDDDLDGEKSYHSTFIFSSSSTRF